MVTATAPKAAMAPTGRGGAHKNPLLIALADALAGALGSVVAVAAFYPIDVAKTRAQASSSYAVGSGASGHGVGEEGKRVGWLRSRTLAALVSLVRKEGCVLRLYEGVEAKTLQALTGSFVYFYAYAFIKGVMRRRTGDGTGALRPSLNLLAAALAGAVNQAFTLPLENITTRIQTAKHIPPPDEANDNYYDDGDDDGDDYTAPDLPPRVTARPSGGSEGGCGGDVAVPAPASSSDGIEDGAVGEPASTVQNEHKMMMKERGHNKSSERGAFIDGVAEDGGGIAGIDGVAGVASSVRDGEDVVGCGDLENAPPPVFPKSGSVGALTPTGIGGSIEEDNPEDEARDRRFPLCVTVNGDARGEGSSWTRPGGEGDGGEGVLESIMEGNNAPPTEYRPEQRRQERQECGQRPRPRRYRRRRQSLLAVALELYREGGGIARFWRGFVPSLILTCNPAINYTAFDLLKALWLRRIAARGVGGSGGGVTQAGARGGAGAVFLDPVEAFLVAAAAKSLATLTTYPLIRAKVILMTCSGSPRSLDHSEATATAAATSTTSVVACTKGDSETDSDHGDGGDGDGDGSTGDASWAGGEEDAEEPLASRQDSITSLIMGEGLVETGGGLAVAAAGGEEVGRSGERSAGGIDEMASVMADIVRNEGVGGLYTGCGAQLLHTILKSALLLATKEQIARATSSAVFVGRRGVKPPPVSR